MLKIKNDKFDVSKLNMNDASHSVINMYYTPKIIFFGRMISDNRNVYYVDEVDENRLSKNMTYYIIIRTYKPKTIMTILKKKFLFYSYNKEWYLADTIENIKKFLEKIFLTDVNGLFYEQ